MVLKGMITEISTGHPNGPVKLTIHVDESVNQEQIFQDLLFDSFKEIKFVIEE